MSEHKKNNEQTVLNFSNDSDDSDFGNPNQLIPVPNGAQKQMNEYQVFPAELIEVTPAVVETPQLSPKLLDSDEYLRKRSEQISLK